MLGLFEIHTDDCTYYHEELLFVMEDCKQTMGDFEDKFYSLYPNTDKNEFLIIATGLFETITAIDKDDNERQVKLSPVESI